MLSLSKHERHTEYDFLRVRQNFNGSDFSVRLPQPFVIGRRVKAFNPDLIHSHHPFLMGDTAIRLARRQGLAVVFTHHTMYERYTHYVPLDSQALKQFVIRLSTDYANLCTRVVAPSKSIARLLEQRGVSTPIEEIPTGVDVAFFSRGEREAFRRQHHIPLEAFVIGHLGRLAPEKNLNYLAQAVAHVAAAFPQPFFLVVGYGPSAKEIKEIFEDRQLSQKLILTGEKTGKSVRDAYHAMDLFVFSSESETQGMVLLEAMACGVPVIALEASGTREVVRDGYNGYLLPENATMEQFSQAIQKIAGDQQRLQTFSREALATARQYYRQICVRRLVELYKTAIDDNGQTDKPQEEVLLSWDRLLESLRLEWQLLSQITLAAVQAVGFEHHSKDAEKNRSPDKFKSVRKGDKRIEGKRG